MATPSFILPRQAGKLAGWSSPPEPHNLPQQAILGRWVIRMRSDERSRRR
jgi:hypothetical protein